MDIQLVHLQLRIFCTLISQILSSSTCKSTGDVQPQLKMQAHAASVPAGVATGYAARFVGQVVSTFEGDVALADATDLSVNFENSRAPAVILPSRGSAEYAYGAVLARLSARQRLADDVAAVLDDGKASKTLATTLQAWLRSREDRAACRTALAFADQWLVREGAFDPSIDALYRARDQLPKLSHWIVVADGWEAGSDVAGIHAILASGEDINVLVLCSDPDPSAAVPSERGNGAANTSGPDSSGGAKAARATTGAMPRRDLGLYALNYGSAYVSSSSPAVDPSQFSSALREADAFKGPALVLAYVPHAQVGVEGAGASEERKESKMEAGDAGSTSAMALARDAVDSGRWPLYRWNPSVVSGVPAATPGIVSAAGEEADLNPAHGVPSFHVDSAKVRADLSSFLDRERALALLARTQPHMHPDLAETATEEGAAKAKAKASASTLKAQFDALMGALSRPPLLVLFGSDGGNAEAIAKRIGAEARTRGYGDVSIRTMDAVTPAALAAAPLAVFVVSTAGQGEFPQNARAFWKGIALGGLDFSGLKYAVFGLGDSNYWPRKEQRIFFNKASVDLDEKLSALSGVPLVARGVGDDQAVGGYNACFREWAPSLWAALGVGSPGDDGTEGAPKVRANEVIKVTSNALRGTIAQGLTDTSTGALTYEDTYLTKFHGIYQQDDRDLRADRKKAGLEQAFSFMVRVRIPGGVASPKQYLNLDTIADTRANGTLRVTTRQAIQFHGILKGDLKPAIAGINKDLMDTLAACGDVNRNVMCAVPYAAAGSTLHDEVLAFSRKLSDHLSPRTTAYAEIWLDNVCVKDSNADVEPIYGPTYLPRKFKIAVAVPPSNDVDVFAHDLGFIAHATPDGKALAGFTVTLGGGMGMSHGNNKTYPRVGSDFAYGTPDQCVAIAEAVVTTQRDYGDRTNRKHARLKYTVDDKGVEWFKKEVGLRVGYTLEAPRSYKFTSNGDQLGWHQAVNGTWSYTFFIQNGRIKDEGSYRLKAGLKALALLGVGHFIFTPNQSGSMAGIPPSSKAAVQALIEEHNILNTSMTGLRLNSMACVALPTCGLALAESERYLPSLLDKLDVLVIEAGLRDDAITIRMTGCPNGCARPYVAEIGFVGRSPGIYNLYLGAGHSGERLSKLYREGLDEEGIIEALRPLVKRYASDKAAGEHFGDWVVRAGVIKATVNGLDFHDL